MISVRYTAKYWDLLFRSTYFISIWPLSETYPLYTSHFLHPFFFMPRHEFLLVHRDYLNIPPVINVQRFMFELRGSALFSITEK